MESFCITVRESGSTFRCREDQSILDAMHREGCGPYHYGCYGGGCGVCKLRVVSGEYHPFRRMSRAHITEAEQRDGIVLGCCISPRSDMTIEGIYPPHTHP
ncbi:MAG: 2Fe-2S iron-sulfur cluster-binding protein [Oscillospiraceae bacterium]